MAEGRYFLVLAILALAAAPALTATTTPLSDSDPPGASRECDLELGCKAKKVGPDPDPGIAKPILPTSKSLPDKIPAANEESGVRLRLDAAPPGLDGMKNSRPSDSLPSHSPVDMGAARAIVERTPASGSSEPQPGDAVGSPPASAERLASNFALARARSAMGRGDLLAADRAAADALQSDPTNAAALVFQSQIANLNNESTRAEQLARAALETQPSAAGYESLAWAALKQGEVDEALDASQKAIERGARGGLAHAIRAYALERAGQRADAVAELREAAARDSRFLPKLQKALAGARIDDSSDASALLDLVAQGRQVPADQAPRLPYWLGLLAAVAAAFGFYAWTRRGWSKAPRAETPDVWLLPSRITPVAPPSRPKLIAEKYQLGRVIGRGGMGVVFEAIDRTLERIVAIKKMSPTVAGLGKDWRDAYIKEARIVASLRHPAIVEIFDIVEAEDDIYLIFEFVRGQTVHQLISEQGPLSLGRSAEILRPICRALAFAHGRKLVHRDLKPMNIMVADDGSSKLMDFGIARVLPGGDPTRTETVRGTPLYMAPESWQGVLRIESDVFSLGVCLYEMITGDLPFKAGAATPSNARFDPPSSRVRGLPAALDELLARALEPDPDKRIGSALDFLRRLEAACGSRSRTPV